MSLSFLKPVSTGLLEFVNMLPNQSLGKAVHFSCHENDYEDLETIDIAILSVPEVRGLDNTKHLDFSLVRKSFYQLYPGVWSLSIADLGDLVSGETIEDTYFLLKTVVSDLLKKNVIPIILGGGQDLMFPIYRAFDECLPMVNIVNIDSCFDLGDGSGQLSNRSFMGKVLVDPPYNLFNYSVLGYQTYSNSQEEKDLLEKLYFEAFRVGELQKDIALAEPVMRGANIVSLDVKSIKASELGYSQQISPNGFTGTDICSLSRYAGISNRVNLFGLFDFQDNIHEDLVSSNQISQILWYFFEGVSCRVSDDQFNNEDDFQKFTLLIDEFNVVFYKSLKTGRWWMESSVLDKLNNNLKQYSLIPCTFEDYNEALQGEVPRRLYKAINKL